MNETGIQPALSAEEWASFIEHGARVQVGIGNPTGRMYSPMFHGCAAVALQGQPFGFTHADVDLLRSFARASIAGEVPHAAAAARSLADRIEALLPPRQP